MTTAEKVLAQLEVLAGENEAVLGSNNTTVNKFFNQPGKAYCGYSLWYAAKKAGSGIFADCANPAYVPTIKTFMESKGWRVANSEARLGDVFVYKTAHVGFVYGPYLGTTVITLEGNSTVYTTEAEARARGIDTGAFEGIGYKKRTLDSDYTVYRPAYEDEKDVPDNSVGTDVSSETIYTVVAGDTLTKIAAKYGTTFQVLAAYNGISNPDVIRVGQKIKIPGADIQQGSKVRVKDGAKTYTGGGLASYVYTTVYEVIQISGDRVVIGLNGVITAAMNVKDLTLV